jgi:hypothetical protein
LRPYAIDVFWLCGVVLSAAVSSYARQRSQRFAGLFFSFKESQTAYPFLTLALRKSWLVWA